MVIFLFFQDGGRLPCWIRCAGDWRLVVFITVQNLVGIDEVVLIVCKI